MKKRATAAQQKGADATRAKALEFALSKRGKLNEYLEWGWSLNQIAQEFNEDGVPSPRGGKWTAKSIANLAKLVEELPPVPVSQERIEAEKRKRKKQQAKSVELFKELKFLPTPSRRRRETGGQLEVDAEPDLMGLALEEYSAELDEAVKRHQALEAEARRFGPPKPSDWMMMELEFEREVKTERDAAMRERIEARKQRRKQAAKK